MSFSVEMIDRLRESVAASMSEWRFRHTAEVELMAQRLGELYAPDKLDMLRAAALLHDITKEKSTEEHLEILRRNGAVSELGAASPKTLHAESAVWVIREQYGEFATDELLSAVGRHTTGHPDMTVTDAVIYLADYIDMSRSFDDCVYLREYFWSRSPELMSEDERLAHLWDTVRVSFDLTLKALLNEGAVISVTTVAARNAMLLRAAGK